MKKRQDTRGYRASQLLSQLNDTQISREVGLSRERIRQIRRYHGIPSPNKNQHCFDDEAIISMAMKIISESDTHVTWVDLSSAMGIPVGILARRFKANGIKKPSAKYNTKITEAHFRDTMALTANNCSEAARILGISRIGIQRYSQRWQVPCEGKRKP